MAQRPPIVEGIIRSVEAERVRLARIQAGNPDARRRLRDATTAALRLECGR